MSSEKHRLSTRLVLAGRSDKDGSNPVSPPIQRASTLLVNKAADLYSGKVRGYGLAGSDLHDTLKDALCALEGAKYCTLACSGLLACTLPILALVDAGGHVLAPDNVYSPTRRYCDNTLQRLGGTVTYYDPDIGAAIGDLIQPNTQLILMESPGSLTLELPDIRAITEVARSRNIPTALDNTWASGHFLNTFDLGVDISVLATTKYAAGHSDILSGACLTHDRMLAARLDNTARDLGLHVSPDDAYMILRGMRTMPMRMKHQENSMLDIASWLATQDGVVEVICPALPGDRYHELWKRDFTGAGSLFSFVLRPGPTGADEAFLDALEVFGLGFSFGGFESLAIHCNPQLKRVASKRTFAGPLMRLAIGMEDVADLKADLERGFAAWRSFCGH